VIVVTGATGYMGGLVAQELAARGEPMRLLVRDVGRAQELPGATVVEADYGDPASLDRALEEGDRVFMVSMHQGPALRVPLHKSFVEAAGRRRVALVVYLSFLNAGPDARFLHARSHGATEQMLRESGLPWVSMRNGMYADEIPGWFDADGVAREPGDSARITFSYRPELARAIVTTLTEPGHEGRIYNVTSESVSLAELANIASEVTGRAYRYEPASHEAWDERWRGLGRNDWELEAGHTAYEALRGGELAVPSDDYRRLTGLAPLTIPEIVEELHEAMPLTRSTV
jgi:uncharacterized protein YbjT (DUF2867 family)